MNQTGVREQLIFLQLYLTTRQLSWEAWHLSSSFGAILYFLVLNNYNAYCWHLSSKSSLSLLSVSRFDKSNQLEGLGVALGFLHVARSKITDQSGKMQFIYNKAFLKTGGPTVGTCWRGCTCLTRPHWTPVVSSLIWAIWVNSIFIRNDFIELETFQWPHCTLSHCQALWTDWIDN